MFDQLENSVREFIIDICEVMHRHGHESVSIGVLMRLFGIDDERASEFDDDYIALDGEFTQALAAYRSQHVAEALPKGTTLH